MNNPDSEAIRAGTALTVKKTRPNSGKQFRNAFISPDPLDFDVLVPSRWGQRDGM